MPKMNPNQGELLPSVTGLEAGACRDCKAPIYWVTMNSGNKMPLDRGADQRIVVGSDGVGRMARVYKQHWASCPFANNFRKIRKDGK